MTVQITRDEVISHATGLPSFPRIVTEILASLDDPETNLNVLSDYITHDPLIAARVLSFANRAAERTRSMGTVRDIYTATSLIGMGRIREIALVSSLGHFIDTCLPEGTPASYWHHSVAVGICAQELAIHIDASMSSDSALIAGLLHDIGQLWFYRFHREAYKPAKNKALTEAIGIETVEREQFSTDHSQVGAWLAENWGLPPSINAAIAHHHAPDAALDDLLVPVVGIAEVLSNALDLTSRAENQVTQVSTGACKRLGLVFDSGIQPLFGRIEARSRHANSMFSN
ncbi:MAG: HDOD domain-containing protein [Azonexus sp.]|nr:HDOD domain-containing protein [Azonexus sp.]